MEIIFIIISSFIASSFITLLFNDKKIIKNISKPKNNVHFYVTCEKGTYNDVKHILWLGKPKYNKKRRIWYSNSPDNLISITNIFTSYGLKYEDFKDMKEGEIREVFLNIEN